MAEGIMADKLENAGFTFKVDSCGFESFHVGDSPDPRAIQTTRKRGIDITSHRARLFRTSDFDEFDLILAMDDTHYRNIMNRCRSDKDREKVFYMLDSIAPDMQEEVQDPWYHDQRAFEDVFQLLDKAAQAWVDKLKKRNDRR